MLYSQHKIEFGIDGVLHKIAIKQLSNKDKKRLKEFQKLGAKKFEEFDEINNQLAALRSDYSLNEQILKEGSFTDKVKLLFEQKSLSKQIRDLEKQLKETHQGREDLAASLEEYYKEMFDLCVTGEGRPELVKDIEDKGFTYKEIFEAMIVLVAKAIEKK